MDVDKLFLATKTYVNGKELTVDDETFLEMVKNNHRNQDRKNLYALYDKSEKIWKEKTGANGDYNINRAVANRLLDNYIDILSDTKTYAAAHASIDVITEQIKDLIVTPIRGESDLYTSGMSTLTPSFQSYRKMEFSVGKAGIAPFALNITNLSLTQYTHLSLDYKKNNYKLGPLDAIYSEDGTRIADWLSAMVNAHVDVAKDPYIFVLNINQATYNMANLLLRSGKGLGTFTFLAQPILKKYANDVNNTGGIYGGNLKGDIDNESEIGKIKRRQVSKRLMLKYTTKILKWLDYDKQLPDDSKQKLSKDDRARFVNAKKYYEAVANRELDKKSKEEGLKSPYDDLSVLLEYTHGIKSIQDDKNKNKTEDDVNIKDLLESYTFLLASLRAFSELSSYADKLALLVRNSQIDTEKFGNTLAKQINWQNRFEQFKYNSTGWVLTDKNFKKTVNSKKEQISQYVKQNLSLSDISKLENFSSIVALTTYFGNSYLDYKFYTARHYTKDLLSGQTFTATKEFETIFKHIMGSKFGFTEWTDVYGNIHRGYNSNSGASEDVAQSVSNAIDNAMRAIAFMKIGNRIFVDLHDQNPDMIDFTEGGNQEKIRERLQMIMYGDHNHADIFNRVRNLINQIKSSTGSKFAEYKDSITGDVSNELLNYLNPVSKFGKEPVGKMSLSHMQSLTSDEEKVRISSAFSQLLNDENEEIRQLAEDIAFYAYYSQYDQNTPNSFFDVVPIEVRKQYDETLNYVAKLLDNHKNEDARKQILIDMIGDDSLTMQSSIDLVEDAYANMILDIISRNYWFDENIVPTYYTNAKTSTFDSYAGDMFGDIVFDKDGVLFPQFILSTNIRNNPTYVNIKSSGKKTLYRRLGYIVRTEKNSDQSDNVKHASSFYIYAPILKLGYRSKNINLFEFTVDDLYGSIFSENKIPGEYRETLVRRDVEKMISKENSLKYDLDVVWESETIPISRGTDSASYLPISYGNDTDTRKVIGTTVYKSSSFPDKDGVYSSDVIIKLTIDQKPKGSDNIALYEDVQNKVVSIKLGESIDDYVDKILSLKSDNSIRVFFGTPYYDYELENSSAIHKEEVDDYVLKKNDELESQLRSDENVDEKNIPQIIASQKHSFESEARRVITLNMINELLSEITNTLLMNGIKIKRFSSSSRISASGNFKSDLAKGVKNIKRAYPQYFEENNLIYVQSSLYSDPKQRMRYFYFVQNSSQEGIVNINYTPDDLSVAENTGSIVDLSLTKINQKQQKVEEDILNFVNQNAEQSESIPDDDVLILNEQNEAKKDNAENKKCNGQLKLDNAVDLLNLVNGNITENIDID